MRNGAEAIEGRLLRLLLLRRRSLPTYSGGASQRQLGGLLLAALTAGMGRKQTVCFAMICGRYLFLQAFTAAAIEARLCGPGNGS